MHCQPPSPCCAPQQEPVLGLHLLGGSQHTQKGQCRPGALQVPDSYCRQTLKLVSISLACCFSCSPGTSPGAG